MISIYQLADLVQKMRNAQRDYFKFRQSKLYNAEELLITAKQIESQIDGAVRAILATARPDDGESVTPDWLRYVGFLPEGGNPNEFCIGLWSVGEADDDRDESPAMHFIWDAADCSCWLEACWLEAYGVGGQSLCIVELSQKRTRGEIRNFCAAIGIGLRDEPAPPAATYADYPTPREICQTLDKCQSAVSYCIAEENAKSDKDLLAEIDSLRRRLGQ